jgi:hypothetical protein
MLTQQQYQKLQGMGLSQNQINQVTQAAGGIQEKKSLGGFIGNVAESGINLVGDTAKAVLNPVETVKNLISLVKDPMVLVDYYKNRYGKDLGETLYNDPVGVLSDLSTLIGGGAAVVKGVNGLSKASKVSTLGRIGSKLDDISRITDPLQLPSRAVGSMTKGITSKLDDASKALLTKGLGNPAQQADLAAKSGIDVSDFIQKYDLYDRTPEAVRTTKRSINKRYGDLIKNSKKTVNINDLLVEIDKRVKSLTSDTGSMSTSNLKAAQELNKRGYQLMQLADESGNITPAKLLEFRKALDTDIPQSTFNLGARQSGVASGAKQTRDIVKGTINSLDNEIGTLGREYGMAKGLENVFRKYQSRSSNRQPLNLGKVSKATAGGVIAGLPGAAAGYLTDVVTNDPRFLKVASKTLKGASTAFKKGIPSKVKTPLKYSYNTARALRMVNQPSSSTQSKKQQIVPDVLSQKLPSQVQKSNTSSNASLPDLTKTFKKNPFKLKKGSFY